MQPSPLPSGSTFESSALAYQAAIGGLGVAIAQTELVRDDLAHGQLVSAHPLKVPSGEIYSLASRTPSRPRSDAAAFRNWILSHRFVREPAAG